MIPNDIFTQAQRFTLLALCLITVGSAACTSAAPNPTPPDGSTAPATSAASVASAPGSASASASGTASAAPTPRVTETFSTSGGDLKITPVYHGTVVFEFGGKVIIVDPWSKGELDKLPKADFILITDIHQDHFDKDAIAKVSKEGTAIYAPPAVVTDLPAAKPIKNGDKLTLGGFAVEGIPMYNKVRGPEAGKLYHDKGRGNGYVVTFGDKRVYLSGDTECTDEMKALKNIDMAFVCMNLPYTMPPSEAAECIRAFKPKMVYPYHYRGSDLGELKTALSAETAVDVRVRDWY